MTMKLWRLASILLALLLVGCSPATQNSSGIPRTSGAEPVLTGTPPPLIPSAYPVPTRGETSSQTIELKPSPGTDYGPAMQPLVEQAITDLAGRLGIQPTQIEALSAETVVWPDTSYGCPQPGMEYLQVPQDGARIRLRAAGREYAYHSGSPKGLFLCEKAAGQKTTPPALDKFVPTPGGEEP